MGYYNKKMINRVWRASKNVFGGIRSLWHSPSHTLFVAGTGRSGTTWVAEVLSKQTNYTFVNEPFNVGPNLKWKPAEYGFKKVNYWPDGGGQNEREYVRQIVRGRELHLPWHQFNPVRFFKSDGYVVKAVLINPCFAEILEMTGAPGIFVVRHPCGVVSSQRNHPGWSHFSKDSRSLPEEVIRDYPKFKVVFESVSSRVELLAFWWAVENIIPLSLQHPHPWELVSYESLVREPLKGFGRLIKHVDGEALSLKQLKRDVQKPSSSTKEYSKPEQSPDCVWKERLSPEEINTICRVVERCGFEKWELFKR